MSSGEKRCETCGGTRELPNYVVPVTERHGGKGRGCPDAFHTPPQADDLEDDIVAEFVLVDGKVKTRAPSQRAADLEAVANGIADTILDEFRCEEQPGCSCCETIHEDYKARILAALQRVKQEAVRNYDPQVLTCVGCGKQYPPGTKPSQDEALWDHCRACPKHPARAWEHQAANDALERAEAVLEERAQQVQKRGHYGDRLGIVVEAIYNDAAAIRALRSGDSGGSDE